MSKGKEELSAAYEQSEFFGRVTRQEYEDRVTPEILDRWLEHIEKRLQEEGFDPSAIKGVVNEIRAFANHLDIFCPGIDSEWHGFVNTVMDFSSRRNLFKNSDETQVCQAIILELKNIR